MCNFDSLYCEYWLTPIVISRCRQRLHLRASVRCLVCEMIITGSVIAMIRVLSLGVRWNYCASWISAGYSCHDTACTLTQEWFNVIENVNIIIFIQKNEGRLYIDPIFFIIIIIYHQLLITVEKLDSLLIL